MPPKLWSIPDPMDVVPIPGTDLFAQRTHTVHVEGERSLDVDFVATFVLGDDGRLELDELTAKRRPGGPPVTTGSLRKLNLTAVKVVAVMFWRQVEVIEPEGFRTTVLKSVDYTRYEGEDEMAFVVRLYRMCAATGEKATRRIALQLDVTESTASQKIWLARKMGLLEPAGRPRGRS